MEDKSSTCGDSFSTVGDTFSTVEVVQCSGGQDQYSRGSFSTAEGIQYIGDSISTVEVSSVL